jgi:NTE family protein
LSRPCSLAGVKGLVLGGGGITGIAWELGLIAGLADHGVDLTTADTVVGTSAGSAVGAQISSGRPIADLFARQLADPSSEATSRMGIGALVQFLFASAWPGDERRARARIGRAALAARTMGEPEFRRVFESMLGDAPWPERKLIVTAVDAESGEAKFFDRNSDARLVDAVAASCAVPLVFPPMSVNGRRYIDGGARSIANADLAAGCDRVVVVAPVNQVSAGSARSRRTVDRDHAGPCRAQGDRHQRPLPHPPGRRRPRRSRASRDVSGLRRRGLV